MKQWKTRKLKRAFLKGLSSCCFVWNLIHKTSGRFFLSFSLFCSCFLVMCNAMHFFARAKTTKDATHPATMRRWSSDPCDQRPSTNQRTAGCRSSPDNSQALVQGFARQSWLPCTVAIALTLRCHRYMECRGFELQSAQFRCQGDSQLRSPARFASDQHRLCPNFCCRCCKLLVWEFCWAKLRFASSGRVLTRIELSQSIEDISR